VIASNTSGLSIEERARRRPVEPMSAPLLQSRAGNAPRRGRARARHDRRNRGTARRVRPRRRQGDGRGARHARIRHHGARHVLIARRCAYERALPVRARRHRDEARVQPPDGAARAGRPVGLDTVLFILDDLYECTAKLSQLRRCCARWWPTASWAGRAARLLRLLSSHEITGGDGIVKEKRRSLPGSLSTRCGAVLGGESLRDRQADSGARAWSPFLCRDLVGRRSG